MGKVSGQYYHTIIEDLSLLKDFQWWGGREMKRMFLLMLPPAQCRIGGVVAKI